MFNFWRKRSRETGAGSESGTRLASSREMTIILEALDRSQAMIQFETDGTILSANENFLAALGYREDEIVGQHHSLFVEPGFEETPEYRGFWQTLREGQFQSGTYKRITKSGDDIWIQASYNPIIDEDGRVTKVIKYASDVTERVLQSADAEGQIAAIGKSQAVISFNLDGTVIDANENFLAAIGYSIDEIRGEHHRLFVDQATRQSSEYEEFWSALRRGEFQAGEFRRVTKKGRELWIQASYNPILDPDGKVLKVVKFASDITAQVQARAEADRVGALVDEKLDNILKAAQDANGQSESAAAASNRTRESVQTIAAAATQFGASADQISTSMEQSKNEVGRAIHEANDADQSTRDLTTAAQAMNRVVDLIQDIAGQIKLLSLNATIEAASAGESGRGFAVVASEVKSLANQVAKATEQISAEIGGMQSVCDTVVDRITRIRKAVEAVDTSVSSVAGSVAEQADTTRSIADKIQVAASEVDAINQNLESISGAAQAASDLAGEGNELFQDLREFNQAR